MAIYTRDKQDNLIPLNIPIIAGKSAYEIAVSNGFVGTEQEWLESLQGEDATAGGITPTTAEIVDGVLTLTTDRYQTVAMKNNTTVVLPEVEVFTEICLIFNATSDLTVLFPSIIRWGTYPRVVKNKINKFTFTYINGDWIGESYTYSYYDFAKPITDGLVCWLDGYDLPTNTKNTLTSGTVWKNRVEGGDDAIIKTIISGGETMSKRNGFFHTNGNGYVVLPSFSANNVDGISIFVDAVINKMSTARYNKMFTLGYGTHYSNFFAMEFGVEEFGKVRSFEFMTDTGILGAKSTATFPMTVKVGLTTSTAKNYSNNVTLEYASTTKYDRIFSNNFLNAETPTNLFGGDTSYGLVLIYNRKLTDEEMLHNYMYSTSIERW